MASTSHRVQFIDLLRGVAVILMVVGHTVDGVLSTEARSTEWFQIYTFFRGFTAPIFLFVSGMAFSVATEKRWDQYVSWSKPLAGRARRILLLFVIGYALHLPFFSFERIVSGVSAADLENFYQADVLHCVAASLLLLHLMIAAARTPDRFARMVLGTALVIALATPLIWAQDLSAGLSSVISPYLNQHQLSLFPLFPYAAFMFFGAGAGHYLQEAKARNELPRYFHRLLIIGAVFASCGVLIDILPAGLYPPHDFWKTSPSFFFVRMGVLILLTTVVASIRSFPSRLREQLATLGQASLLVYTLHLVIVYGSALSKGLTQLVGRTLDAPFAFASGAVLLLVMLGAVHTWNYVSRYRLVARNVQIAFAGTFLVLFLIRPY